MSEASHNSSQPAAADAGAAPSVNGGEAHAVAANLPPDDAAPVGAPAAAESPAADAPVVPMMSDEEAEAAYEARVAAQKALAERDVAPLEEVGQGDEPPKMEWYILKVQSNREDSIRDGLQRRVSMAGLDRYFGDIIVPTEMVSEFKGGKKRIVKRKLYPGYLVVRMEINEETWFLVRETPGIGDFTGSAGKPTPMLASEVAKIVAKHEEKIDEAPKVRFPHNVGDRVKIKEGTFENFEGDIDAVDMASGRVTIMINIFGRSTPVELEHWQIESI